MSLRTFQPRPIIAAVIVLALAAPVSSLFAQAPAAPAAASAALRPAGTVKAISGNTITLSTDANQVFSVDVAEGARVLQLAPGSTDLKAAQAITVKDISVGDRILVTGKAGDAANSVTASRVILMKGSDIAAKNAAETADWQKRGSGGIVTAVDATANTIAITSGKTKVTLQMQRNTILRRYAPDSVKFENAQPGTLAQIQPGDQLRVRGTRSADGATITADEIVSGSFQNIAGTIASIDAPTGTITVKDLATKKTLSIHVTANSDMRKLEPQIAAMFAARAGGGAGARGGAGRPAGAPPAADGAPRPRMELAQVVPRMPTVALTDLHNGDAIMIVASTTTSAQLTAITVLSGVEPMLAATPKDGDASSLPGWNLGGGDGGGEQ